MSLSFLSIGVVNEKATFWTQKIGPAAGLGKLGSCLRWQTNLGKITPERGTKVLTN